MGKFPIPYPWGLEFTLAKISPPRPQAKRIIKKAAKSDGVLENAISRGHASCWKGDTNFRSQISKLEKNFSLH